MSTGVTIFCCVKNDMLRLPFFFEHYRKLGIENFVMIDNCSDDGSYEFLEQQHDVTLCLEKRLYRECNHGLLWLNKELNNRSIGEWALTVDTDELLVFPFAELTSINELVTFLEIHRFDAFVAPMIDMYADAPLGNVPYRPGESLIEACPYFDRAPYSFQRDHRTGPIIKRGGVRLRLFEKGFNYRGNAPPFLYKVPLVKWDASKQYRHSTHILDDSAALASITGALLHFNLLGDIRSLQTDSQYPTHLLDFNPVCERSVRYKDTDTLVENNLMHVTEIYRNYLRKIGYLI